MGGSYRGLQGRSVLGDEVRLCLRGLVRVGVGQGVEVGCAWEGEVVKAEGVQEVRVEVGKIGREIWMLLRRGILILILSVRIVDEIVAANRTRLRALEPAEEAARVQNVPARHLTPLLHRLTTHDAH